MHYRVYCVLLGALHLGIQLHPASEFFQGCSRLSICNHFYLLYLAALDARNILLFDLIQWTHLTDDSAVRSGREIGPSSGMGDHSDANLNTIPKAMLSMCFTGCRVLS
jgi:hypothetical protein